jgi:hypothetical protein
MTEPDDTVRLGREHADELAADISALGAWLHQASDEIRQDFARHAFPDPRLPGATVEDFLLALADAHRALLYAFETDEQTAGRR